MLYEDSTTSLTGSLARHSQWVDNLQARLGRYTVLVTVIRTFCLQYLGKANRCSDSCQEIGGTLGIGAEEEEGRQSQHFLRKASASFTFVKG